MRTAIAAILLSTVIGGCTSDDGASSVADSSGADDIAESGGDTTTVEDATTQDTAVADDDASTDGTDGGTQADTSEESDAGETPNTSCEQIAATFVTLGSANDNLPAPKVSATCIDGSVVVTSNQIPDFPYVETSPGIPTEFDLEFTIPAEPVVAETPGAVPALGALGVAINGIPIYGPTEGAGGDVLSLGGGFNECGGHNGPTGYHYHLFDVEGSDDCRFSEAEATAAPVLFGWAFDGYPIYSGNFQYKSSYELTDESLFASDTWSAHTYVEGLGDLDECNGRTDDNGNYAYYTTDTFPYVLGCYRGEVAEGAGGEGGGGPGGGGPPGGGPPQ